MKTFMVERSLQGISMAELAAAQKAAIRAAEELSWQGTAVAYLRSTFVPETGHCMCLFTAHDLASVKAANDKARLPYFRIVPVLDLAPQPAPALP